ncbi:hypothetical protein I4U23_017836 [Adineta vaga]|nr:hypothetical protein I4U23_017836 [Adineta vaga]
MTLKSIWKGSSNDENSRQSLLSDCDLSPLRRGYDDNEKRSISALKMLSINRYEPSITRSRMKTFEKPIVQEQCRSTLRCSIDSFETNSLSDRINSLTDYLENCSLDENKLNRKYCWSCHQTNSHSLRQINPFLLSSSSLSSHTKSQSNRFSLSQTTTIFDEDQTQLWSRSRSTISTILKDKSSQSSKEDVLSKYSLTIIFFSFLIFIMGLVLGYFLTNTFPPIVLYQWLILIWNRYVQLIKIYLEIILRYFFSCFLF